METNHKIQKTRIDRNISLLFLLTIVTSASVLAYRYANYKPCSIVDFKSAAKNYRVDEIIRFKDYSQNVEVREWDFGDSTETSADATPFHVYKSPGKYTVRLVVNGNCDSEQIVSIQEKAFVLDSTKLASFKAPKFTKVGKLIKLEDLTADATQWEWRFGETAEVNSTLKDPTYIYRTPGIKTITLVTNGDARYASRVKIQVLADKITTDVPQRKIEKSKEAVSIIKYEPEVIPVQPPPSIKSAPDPAPVAATPTPPEKKPEVIKSISKAEFEKLLIQVTKKKASSKDFEKHLCGNLSAPAIVKSKKTTFSSFCKKISGKNITIKNLQLYKNKKTNCIEYIKLDYKKNSLL